MRLFKTGAVFVAITAMLLTGCTTDKPSDEAEGKKDKSSDGDFFVKEDYEKQLAQREVKPEGDADKPWMQAIDPKWVDTTKYKKKGGDATLCFSNASVSNP
ncbi:MAG: ABC transporter substrate-binding protein, partial [Stackebrandtia sp.]